MQSLSDWPKLERVRVAVLESDPVRRAGLREVLGSVQLVEVVCESPPGELQGPGSMDIVLWGCHVPHDPDHEVRQLSAACPGVPVLMVGSPGDDERVLNGLSAGAKGYVSDLATAQEVIDAVLAVSRGCVWASGRILAALIDRISRLTVDVPSTSCPFTRRERQVLTKLAGGLGNKEIGTALGIEERTVKAHIAQLMRKVGAPNRTTLAVRAVSEWGLPLP